MIPLDFVPGTHGHFIEYVLNRAMDYSPFAFDPFTAIGTSHQRPVEYLASREIICGHWSENDTNMISTSPKTIRITFDKDDILLVSSLSLLRSADLNIDNDALHIDTVKKLNNRYYADTLEKIYQSYKYLDRNQPSIPRNVLREFFKFGFANPDVNGYWVKLQNMIHVPANATFEIELKKIYDIDLLIDTIKKLGHWLGRSVVDITQWLPELHSKFKSKVPFLTHKSQCEIIIEHIIHNQTMTIPKLSLLQESYINGKLESIFRKEMPFHQIDYFTNTKDVLQYITNQAPDI